MIITFLSSIISLKQLSVFVKAKVWDDQDCNWLPSVSGSAYLDALELLLFPQLIGNRDETLADLEKQLKSFSRYSIIRDLDTTQRKHLQNFSKPTETVFCQGPRFFGWFKAFSEGRESIEDEPRGVNRFLASKNIPVASQPPYSPDLSPCDFFLFPKLKNHLKGHHFGTLENIQTVVTDQLKAIPMSEFHQCCEEWKKRLQRCVASEGSYFEGDNAEL
ncbi:putative transposase [Trichonephila clavipes]|nr:putative transposase [Trichonephila clavipes]